MNLKLISSAAILLLSATGAFAGSVPSVKATSVIATTGSFTEILEWTTSSGYNNNGSIFVTGPTNNFSALSLTFFDADNTLSTTPKSVNVGSASGSSFKTTFNDVSVSSFSLAANTKYKAILTGTSKVAGSSLALNGTYFSAVSVTPVPEPETYAMLLAGLGLMGAIAKRRKDKQA